jgi:hypothetical protein
MDHRFLVSNDKTTATSRIMSATRGSGVLAWYGHGNSKAARATRTVVVPGEVPEAPGHPFYKRLTDVLTPNSAGGTDVDAKVMGNLLPGGEFAGFRPAVGGNFFCSTFAPLTGAVEQATENRASWCRTQETP